MAQSTLVLTQIVFRHGQRAPDLHHPYEGDPYANELYLPFGPGELTLNGRKQCYYLGQKFRERYGDFLGPEYYPGIVDAKSSDRSRTRISLQLVLASLFPPTQTTQIEDLNWQPIPFTSKPLEEDKLIGGVILLNYEDVPLFGTTSNSQDIINCMKQELNWDLQNQPRYLTVYDIIRSQVDIGLPIPQWCSSIFPEKLSKEFHDYMRYNFNRKGMVNNMCGALLEEIAKNMIQKSTDTVSGQNRKTPKMFLYSGHDINVLALLCTLMKFDDAKWPYYGANIAFELHRIDEEFFVKIVYQDGPKDPAKFYEEEELQCLKLGNSEDELIKLSDFVVYTEEHQSSL